MPSLKVKVNPEAKSAFESYDGPDVPVGNGYEGVIKSVRVKQSKGTEANPDGNLYLNVLVEHNSKDSVKKQYNGAPQWIRVMFGEHDETQARLAAFIKAVTGKANKEANIVDTDEEARAGTGSIVKSIDGVKPEGKRVKFDVRMEAAQNGYPARTTADFIRRAIDAPSAAPVEEDEIDEDDIEVDGDEESVPREDREKELKGLPIKELREAAKAAEIDTAGLKKPELIQAILDWEYEDVEDEDEDSEEADDVDVEEDDIEGDEEDEEEDEEGEDDEEDEDEDDPESELRAELADLDRSALKARLKASDAEFKVLKKHTDDDLRDAVVSAELSEPPF